MEDECGVLPTRLILHCDYFKRNTMEDEYGVLPTRFHGELAGALSLEMGLQKARGLVEPRDSAYVRWKITNFMGSMERHFFVDTSKLYRSIFNTRSMDRFIENEKEHEKVHQVNLAEIARLREENERLQAEFLSTASTDLLLEQLQKCENLGHKLQSNIFLMENSFMLKIYMKLWKLTDRRPRYLEGKGWVLSDRQPRYIEGKGWFLGDTRC